MNSISDIIEKFILDAIKQDEEIDLSRNELANFFGCSPSQINYVLSTRFTLDRGFDVTSQRGGGGYIRLVRVSADSLVGTVVSRLKEPIDYLGAKHIIENLVFNDVLKEDEAEVLSLAVSEKALSNPINNEDYLRSQILKNVLINIKRGK